jgi:hypothetical protein
MQIRSSCLLTFALQALAALALPDAHITGARAVPSNRIMNR